MVSCAQLELGSFVSLHLRFRKFPSAAAYTQTLRVLAALYDRAHGRSAASSPTPEVHLPCRSMLCLLLWQHLAGGLRCDEGVMMHCMLSLVHTGTNVHPGRLKRQHVAGRTLQW